ncbi:translation initiation factor IF-2 [Alphaproteobacteria bacterium LSUCC0684]
MKVKVHWIIDGIAEMDVATPEEAEAKVEEMLKDVMANSPSLLGELGARAIQGKAFLPGSEDDPDAS